MTRNRFMIVVGLLIAASMLLSACGPKAASPAKGPLANTVVFVSQDSAEAAVSQLKAGEIDIYAYSVSDPTLFEDVKADPNLSYSTAYGSYTEITFNPSGPTFQDGRLNPFSNPKIREAMNWLVDRNYIAQEIYGGLAVPKYTSLNSSFADYARYVDTCRQLEAYYAHDPQKAEEVITAEMEAMGAELVNGKWQYNGAPVTIIGIIRTEDERMAIGDYVSNLLEDIGFTVDRQYKTRSEASPIWNRSNPAEGQWHFYTGGWITTAISRDDATNFGYFYTPLGSGSPLWQAYTPSEEFKEVAERLWTNDFKSMEERGELFRKALKLANEDSVRVWLVDQISFSPQKKDLVVTYDLAGGVAGSAMWPYTIRWEGKEGGTVKWSQPGVLIDPWNPIGGSNWIYDQTPARATMDYATLPDPFTGLAWPERAEKVELTAQKGLPISKTLDWISLEFVDEIQVPGDAWADWDAANQKFITVAEKYPEGTTSLIKSVIYYPKDLFDKVAWHDGSRLSVGDFVMSIIMTFDPGKEESAIYDEAAVPTLEAFQSHFKGVRIVSEDPLVIETYDDMYYLDAELNVFGWWPNYAYGPGSWHALALGILAESNKELAFTADKADALQVEWMSYVAGPSLDILKKYADQAKAENYIPYAPTLGQYVKAGEARARWNNILKWYETYKHFWVGTGPFYLEKVNPVESTLTLQRNAAFPDAADKWARFGAPKIAVVEITGPTNVTIGSEATFEVLVTYRGAPYPLSEIVSVKYLLYNAKGQLVGTGEAGAVEDGKYKIVLPPEATSLLEAGSNKLEVAVTSLVVSVPSFASIEFVTAP